MVFGRKKGDVIDAGAELERAEQDRVDGQFGSSELASEKRPVTPGARTMFLLAMVVIAVVLVTLSYKALSLRGSAEDEEEKPQDTVRQVIPGFTPRPVRAEPEPPQPPQPIQPVPAIQQQPAQVPVRPVQPAGPREKSPYELARERMLKSGLTNTGGSDVARPEGGEVPAGGLTGGGNGGGELAEKLQPMRLSGSQAGQLGNRDLLITQGTQLDCVLETKVITTQPGMTSCHLTRDVYSTSKRVVLLDKGSKVVGFYQGGLTQGQARIFVQWSRVETPTGVVINLDSPGTGPLGEAGLGGWIDRHFWERFGGAIMISMIGDLGDWASRQGSSQGDNSIQFSNTSNGIESAAAEALRNSINIPPTLYKNQGERVSIMVARDLDFSNVYSLESVSTFPAIPTK